MMPDTAERAVDPDLFEADEHAWIARDTGIPAARFPATSPWTVAEALACDPPAPAPRAPRAR